MNYRNRQGFVLVTVLMITAMVLLAVALITLQTRLENNQARDQSGQILSESLTVGGILAAQQLLDGPLSSLVRSSANSAASYAARWSFGLGNGIAPEQPTVEDAMFNLANQIQAAADPIVCGFNQLNQTNRTISIRVHFASSACGLGLPVGASLAPGRFVKGQPTASGQPSAVQTYELPFVAVVTGTLGEYRQTRTLKGSYLLELGTARYSRYAWFTNSNYLPDGSPVWFTNRTIIEGPVHTNGILALRGQPHFSATVSAAGCNVTGENQCLGAAERRGSFFYEGTVAATKMNPTAQAPCFVEGDCPKFNSGVDWSSPHIPMPLFVDNPGSLAARANGILIHGDVASLILYTAPDPTNPDQDVQVMSFRAGSDTFIYYYAGRNQPLKRWSDNVQVWPSFNESIWITGNLNRLSGDGLNASIAPFANLTVGARGHVRITGSLTYSRSPCHAPPSRTEGIVTPAKCDDLSAANFLWIYALQGNILIGGGNPDPELNAPDNLSIQAHLLAGVGGVGAEQPNAAARGIVDVLGGIVQAAPLPFGGLDPSNENITSGYGLRLAYDPRLAYTENPYYPSTFYEGVLSGTLRLFPSTE